MNQSSPEVIDTMTSVKFLESLQRFDLAALLRVCEASLEQVEIDDGWIQDLKVLAIVRAPQPVDEALRKLSPHDQKRVVEAIGSASAMSIHEDVFIQSADGGSIT
jgi:hypothetical protein